MDCLAWGVISALYCLYSDEMLEADKGKAHSSSNNSDVRTYERHMEMYADYAKGNKQHANVFENCINPPIIGDQAYVNTSVMPLHVFLGIGEMNHSIVKTECELLDRNMKVCDCKRD